MNVNTTIKTLMKVHGVTSAELARRSGIKAPNIHRMLRDGVNVTVASIDRMADALGYRAELTLELIPVAAKRWGPEHLEKWAAYAREAVLTIDPMDAPTNDYHAAKQWKSAVVSHMADERLEKELENV